MEIADGEWGSALCSALMEVDGEVGIDDLEGAEGVEVGGESRRTDEGERLLAVA